MFKSFSISNFKCFSSLSLHNLKRFNLIIGKNNTGKTALLEAVWLNAGPMNPTLPNAIMQFRGLWPPKLTPEILWNNLFYNNNINETIKLVGIYPDSTHATLSIKLIPKSTVEIPNVNIEDIQKAGGITVTSEAPVQSLEYTYKHRSTPIKRTISMLPGGFNIAPPISSNPFHSFFLSSRYRTAPSVYAERLGQLKLVKKEHLVINTLKLLEPNLKDITIIPLGGEPTIHADTGRNVLIPLQLLGEGMVRVSQIAIDIVSAPDGLLLVDDIDTGIHYTVMPHIWAPLSHLANEHNVQIFASTHNSECIQFAHDAFMNMDRYDLSVYRLQRIRNSVKVFYYDKDTLQPSIETGLDVR